MIRRFLRRAAAFIASPGLVVGLLVFVAGWSALATVIAQGGAASPAVVAWARANPAAEPLVGLLGLHNAFGSYLFLACVLLLSTSTVVCAWRRTKAALARARELRSARTSPLATLESGAELTIACVPGADAYETLSAVSAALAGLGIRTARNREALTGVSSPWAVWGSTVFHWALVALVLAVVAGQMLRSEGLIALSVTQSKPDAAKSYQYVQSGPLRDWSAVGRSVRLDALEPDYKFEGIDRGAVPTVSVLDSAGNVLVTQRVYQNNMLHSGSLAISAPVVGLSVWFVSLDASGTIVGRFTQPVDFSQEASGGTDPALALTRRDPSGEVADRLYVSVPLDRVGAGYGDWVPEHPTVRVQIATAAGQPLVDKVIAAREELSLPGGGSIRLLGVGWYSGLALVDDPTIPFVYGAMLLAMVGLAMTLLFRQQLLVAGVVDSPDGPKLVARIRLWRNTGTNRSEIESALVRAVAGDEEASAR